MSWSTVRHLIRSRNRRGYFTHYLCLAMFTTRRQSAIGELISFVLLPRHMSPWLLLSRQMQNTAYKAPMTATMWLKMVGLVKTVRPLQYA